MSLSGVRIYGETSLLIALALAVLWVAWRFLGIRDAQASRWVTLAYVLLVAALAAPVAVRLGLRSPVGDVERPVQIWSGSSGEGGRIVFTVAGASDGTGERPVGWGGSVAERSARLAFLALALISCVGVALLLVRWSGLRRHCRSLTPLRARGRLRICVSDTDAAPYSAWTGDASFVVLPVDLLADPPRLRLAIQHELAHIRRGDTVGACALALVRALFPWNPAVSLWMRVVGQLQEYACDQAVLQRGASLVAYADCLVRTAQRPSGRIVGARVAVGLGRPRFLKRRVEMLMRRPEQHGPWLTPAVAAVGVALIGVVAGAATGSIADRRVARAEVEALAGVVQAQSGFEVPVDETVVEQLGLMVGAQEPRLRWHTILERAATVRPTIEPILREHGIPLELAAVAMVESGFENIPPAPEGSGRRGAGVWQFIPETARHFGLRVDDTADERMDIAKSTAAAARYLKELHAQFGDWPLAIAAYTHGESKVGEVTAASESRDAAKLVKAGALSPYSSQVLAAMLLTARPELVE